MATKKDKGYRLIRRGIKFAKADIDRYSDIDKKVFRLIMVATIENRLLTVPRLMAKAYVKTMNDYFAEEEKNDGKETTE